LNDKASVTLEIMTHLRKAAQELGEPTQNGKLFGYDCKDIANILQSPEDTKELLSELYKIEERFGCDPMYYGVAPVRSLEVYLSDNGFLPNSEKE
jgi:hypothetical protein